MPGDAAPDAGFEALTDSLGMERVTNAQLDVERVVVYEVEREG